MVDQGSDSQLVVMVRAAEADVETHADLSHLEKDGRKYLMVSGLISQLRKEAGEQECMLLGTRAKVLTRLYYQVIKEEELVCATASDREDPENEVKELQDETAR